MKQTIRSLGPLLVAAFGFLVSWSILHALTDEQKSEHVDPFLLGVICTSYLIAAGTMLLKTRSGPWSILGAGLLATMLADGLLYFQVLAITQEWTTWYDVTMRTIHEEPGMRIVALGTTSPIIDIGRSLLFVGGPFLLVGAVLEWRTSEGAA